MAKMWAVDIDGTITEDRNGTIHLEALGALRRLAASGHRVVYVTGRSSVEAFMLSVFGGTGGMAVGENGGCVTIDANSHITLGDIRTCRHALEALRSVIPGIREKAVFPRMTEVVLERTFDIDAAKAAARDLSLGVDLWDSGYAYHINSAGVDKGRGLREAMARYGAARDDTIAIGDSQTDVPMFREAGISIALGNAADHIKRQASMNVAAHAGDGVLEALRVLAPGIEP